ncbi:hypothetical protein CABS01_06936 [Colletotrichum abscissum]|uniref:uncharacterized protein n=1 Tax=Colletotrichum abscissum TaxID=1671311 RepID=UPI0027D6116E|nr:uncharacterized protein CABS01_06936 [Colletotrichum abscissum]KAK1514957.1 hypothetical protein CABS01_06936 [Colletotrichum abscissum]
MSRRYDETHSITSPSFTASQGIRYMSHSGPKERTLLHISTYSSTCHINSWPHPLKLPIPVWPTFWTPDISSSSMPLEKTIRWQPNDMGRRNSLAIAPSSAANQLHTRPACNLTGRFPVHD